MAFLKESVEKFLSDHKDALSADFVARVEKAISEFAAGEELPADAANKIFGDLSTAQWFLAEVMANPAHMEVAFGNKPDGSGQ